jgi:excisionase family DNA binding protein
MTTETNETNEATAGLLDVEGAAKFLGVSKSWVYQAAARGELPAYRVGRKVRFTLELLRSWLEKQKTKPAQVVSLGRT